MPDRSAQVSKRQERERVKSQALFLAYKNMGPDRTLEKLHEMCLYIGLKLAVNTIKRYSVKYGWQRQILELQSKEAEERESDVARLVDDMNKQDASLAQGMKGLVAAGINFKREHIKKKAGTDVQVLEMEFKDITNLARTAQQIERLARGEATSRTEVWTSVASTVVREFVLIFMAVNDIEDRDQRKDEFVRLGDEMMMRYYSEATKRSLEYHGKD